MAYSVVPTVSTSDSWTASQHNTYLKDNMAALKALIDAMGQTLFPVGSIYTSVVSTDPGTFLGGTWTSFGSGRVLVGRDAGQTEFDTAEETGGAKTHTLSAAEMPSHTHTVAGVPSSLDATTYSSSDLYGIFATATINTGSAGSGSAHNNLQPYIVVYFFKRTA